LLLVSRERKLTENEKFDISFYCSLNCLQIEELSSLKTCCSQLSDLENPILLKFHSFREFTEIGKTRFAHIQKVYFQRLLNIIFYYSCRLFLASSTFPKQLENTALFSTVRATVHINPSRKRSFSETLIKPEKFETFAFRMWTENILKRELFENGQLHDDHAISLPEFPADRIQNDRWLLGFQFLRCSADRKHLMRLQSKFISCKCLRI